VKEQSGDAENAWETDIFTKALNSQTHKDLEVWNQGIDLVAKIYSITNHFPKEELYGLTSQIRRSAISVPSNIAEGYARASRKELIQFLYISLGSISELETQIIIAVKLGFISDEQPLQDIEIVRRKLLNLIKYQKSKISE
jgi:four helix bundle protein